MGSHAARDKNHVALHRRCETDVCQRNVLLFSSRISSGSPTRFATVGVEPRHGVIVRNVDISMSTDACINIGLFPCSTVNIVADVDVIY